jgi:hypothetical protein
MIVGCPNILLEGKNENVLTLPREKRREERSSE